jgi:hypothetical protein
MSRARLVPVLLSLALAGCAAKADREHTPARGLYEHVLTQEDMREAPYNNMYDVVNALRGNWLRGSLLAVDGLLVGSTNELRSIRPMDVQSVQLLNVHQAKTLFGMQMNFRRAIMVTTKRPTPQTASTPANGG